MPDDVIVPKEVEHKIRALHPPEQHEAEMERARGIYRTLREDRKKELAALREPDPWDPEQGKPSAGQMARIEAHKAKKKQWAAVKRKKARRIKWPSNKYPSSYPAEITGSEAVVKSVTLRLVSRHKSTETHNETFKRGKQAVVTNTSPKVSKGAIGTLSYNYLNRRRKRRYRYRRVR